MEPHGIALLIDADNGPANKRRGYAIQPMRQPGKTRRNNTTDRAIIADSVKSLDADLTRTHPHMHLRPTPPAAGAAAAPEMASQ